jgi:DNA-binding HxlR family transcriptional regulator
LRWEEIGQMPCSVARALAIVGDRWSVLLLRDALLGARRFDDFQASLGISPAMLTRRLRKLVDEGMLEPVAYQDRPTRYEYRLTEMGRDFHRVIVVMMAWGDRWLAGEDAPPIELVHHDCGQVTRASVVCGECGEALSARSVTARVAHAAMAMDPNPRTPA